MFAAAILPRAILAVLVAACWCATFNLAAAESDTEIQAPVDTDPPVYVTVVMAADKSRKTGLYDPERHTLTIATGKIKMSMPLKQAQVATWYKASPPEQKTITKPPEAAATTTAAATPQTKLSPAPTEPPAASPSTSATQQVAVHKPKTLADDPEDRERWVRMLTTVYGVPPDSLAAAPIAKLRELRIAADKELGQMQEGDRKERDKMISDLRFNNDAAIVAVGGNRDDYYATRGAKKVNRILEELDTRRLSPIEATRKQRKAEREAYEENEDLWLSLSRLPRDALISLIDAVRPAIKNKNNYADRKTPWDIPVEQVILFSGRQEWIVDEAKREWHGRVRATCSTGLLPALAGIGSLLNANAEPLFPKTGALDSTSIPFTKINRTEIKYCNYWYKWDRETYEDDPGRELSDFLNHRYSVIIDLVIYAGALPIPPQDTLRENIATSKVLYTPSNIASFKFTKASLSGRIWDLPELVKP